VVADRPLAKYEDGRLWLDRGGIYQPATRFNVLTMWATFKNQSGPVAESYAKACRESLDQYEAAMEDAT